MNPMTLAEFGERIVRPRLISGIQSGEFDKVLMNELLGNSGMYSGEVLAAMVARARIISAPN